MSEPVNPYAAPMAATVAAPLPGQSAGGVWRQGNVLVMHKHATLPPICVKSNEPADRMLLRKMQWHPPWLVALVLIAVPVYIIVALILTKRARVHIGLSDPWYARRWRAIWIGWGLAVGGIAAIFAEGSLLVEFTGVSILVAIAGVLGGLIYGQYGSRMVYPSQITDEHVWLKGCCREFLNRFPPLP